MNTHAFTGPSRLTPRQHRWVTDELARLPEAERRSGGAFGVDTIVALETFPTRVTLVVPEGEWYNRDLIFTPGVIIQFVSGGYRLRNEALVRGADVLHAFLRSPEFYRSGEWMTVNIAKRLGVPVVQHVLPWGD